MTSANASGGGSGDDFAELQSAAHQHL